MLGIVPIGLLKDILLAPLAGDIILIGKYPHLRIIPTIDFTACPWLLLLDVSFFGLPNGFEHFAVDVHHAVAGAGGQLQQLPVGFVTDG